MPHDSPLKISIGHYEFKPIDALSMSEIFVSSVPVAANQHVTIYGNPGRHAVEEKARKDAAAQEAASASTRASEFAKKNNASGWVDWQKLRANPFNFEGKALLFNTRLDQMDTPTSGFFQGDLHVSGIPRGKFGDNREVVLAGKVLGSTKSKHPGIGIESIFVKVEYLDVHFCTMKGCKDMGTVRR